MNGIARRETKRLVAGRGAFTGDITAPRLAHVAFLRSPHAHARIVSIDVGAARLSPGVLQVATARDIDAVCKPMHAVLTNEPSHNSPPQQALAADVSRWQGEPIVAVVAETAAAAEDALELIAIDWEPLAAVTDASAALAPGAPVIHAALGHNCALDRVFGQADVGAPLRQGDALVEYRFSFNRHTGVPLEPRVTVADYDPIEGSLVVRQSHQAPHQMQDVYARLLDLPLHKVRVICADVGGGFGIKLHAYPDEVATVALAKMLGRPIRFEGRRTEAFVSDAHAREFEVAARLAARADGMITAIDSDLLCAAGAYSIYPRGSIGDAVLASVMIGAPYRVGAQRARARAAYLNKVPTGSYRGVGQPVACAVTEVLVDEASHALGLDPVEFRRRAYHQNSGGIPIKTAGGLQLQQPSLTACLDELVRRMDYPGLRAEQSRLRDLGRLRGIGIATFIEITAPGAWLYGPANVRVSTQDTAIVSIDPAGMVRCQVGCTDQGQGTLTGIAQIVSDAIGLPLDHVVVDAGDTAGPYGGGAWASRGLSISGEAAHHAARRLRGELLTLAAALLQAKAGELDLRDGVVVSATDGEQRISLAELCRIGHFRQDLLPAGTTSRFTANESFVPNAPYFAANGVQGCLLDVDRDTGETMLLKHWVVEDCGRIVNPDLVDGQLRGGVVQGLGAAFLEHCIYDDTGQLLTGSLLDYAMPRADNMPTIDIGHCTTRQSGTALGLKGVGEAGTVGAAAAAWCALNDALRPLGARVERMPFTAERVLAAIDRGLRGPATPRR